MKNLHWISLLALMLLVIFGFGIIVVRQNYPTSYSQEIEKYSTEYGVDKALVYAIIKKESGFNPMSVSSAGAVGLMQLMPETAEWFAESIGESYSYNSLFNPDYNIMIGVRYLKYLFNKFSNLSLVLCAYNAGEGVTAKWVQNVNFSEDDIPYRETYEYVQKVKKYYDRYKFLIE